MSSEFVFVYTTLPDEPAARAIAQDLVRARLAACANVHAPMTSVYEWEGRLEAASECACFFKTSASLVPKLMTELRKRHPYTVPAMLVLPITGGNDDYLAWVRDQTRA
jgi:periplasmic divalent cation tolerance protein